MYRLLCSLGLLASAAVGALAADLDIDVTVPVECERKTQNGDKVEMHYRGTLQADGKQFDASYDRGTPFSFQLGAGRVIKGWDQGLLDMCIGEKRTLTIPPELGYGNRGMGPIPGGSTLVFETELMGIQGVPKPETISYKSTTTEATPEETGVAGKIAEKVGEAVGEAAAAAGTMILDTDDVTDHQEL